MIEANWSGVYPSVCYGKWTLKVNGRDVSDKIPEDLKEFPMNTRGTYKRWHFENWEEVFEVYEDGLECDAWIAENTYWLATISTDYRVQKEIYHAINKCDFRGRSCGGCI